MKRSFFVSLAIFCSVAIFSFAHAQTPRSSIPKFTPTVKWDISPTEMAEVRGLEALKLPCIMKAGYNNGFVIRFSGGGNRIMAMAIDFRQRVFTRDKVYNARININRSGMRSINAEAFSESVLIFDLKNYPNLYRELAGANTLGLEVEGNPMEFSMGNTKAALQRLEQCYTSTTGQKSMRMASAPRPMPSLPSATPSMAMSSPAPNVYSGSDLSRPRISRPVTDSYVPADYSSQRVAGAELAKSMREPRFGETGQQIAPGMMASSAAPRRIQKLEMPSTMSYDPAGSRLPRPPMMNNEMVSQSATSGMAAAPASNAWNANAGEDMRSVLGRWANRAGVDLQWEANNSGRVARDVNVVGTFEEAVQTLMAQNAAALGLEADMRQDHGMQHASYSPSYSNSGSSWQGSMGGSKWVAASGASLRETLQSWSVKEGVAFLWKAGREYKVKAPVQSNGDYTQALQQLLNQYANDTMRPAAEYNVDPTSGNKLLTVE